MHSTHNIPPVHRFIHPTAIHRASCTKHLRKKEHRKALRRGRIFQWLHNENFIPFHPIQCSCPIREVQNKKTRKKQQEHQFFCLSYCRILLSFPLDFLAHIHTHQHIHTLTVKLHVSLKIYDDDLLHNYIGCCRLAEKGGRERAGENSLESRMDSEYSVYRKRYPITIC